MVSGMWRTQCDSVILIAVIGSAVLLAVILLMNTSTAKLVKFNHADKIAPVFCASKKSLPAGAPRAALIFRDNPGLGLILLPIMIYHPLQLIVCSVMDDAYPTRPSSSCQKKRLRMRRRRNVCRSETCLRTVCD